MLAELSRRHPELGQLQFPDHQVAGAVLVTVGDHDLRALNGLATSVSAAEAISIVSAMASGWPRQPSLLHRRSRLRDLVVVPSSPRTRVQLDDLEIGEIAVELDDQEP